MSALKFLNRETETCKIKNERRNKDKVLAHTYVIKGLNGGEFSEDQW